MDLETSRDEIVPPSPSNHKKKKNKSKKEKEMKPRSLWARFKDWVRAYQARQKQRQKKYFKKLEESENPIRKVQLKLGEFLESRKFHLFIIFLILLDIALLLIELSVIDAECVAAEQAANPNVEPPSHLRAEPIEGEHYDPIHTLEEVFFYFTLTILSVFALDVIGLLFVFEFYFFLHPFYVLDMIFSVGGIAIEVIFHTAFGSLVILARLWRVLRMIWSVSETSNAHLKNQHEKWKKKEAKYKKKLGKLNSELKKYRNEVEVDLP